MIEKNLVKNNLINNIFYKELHDFINETSNVLSKDVYDQIDTCDYIHIITRADNVCNALENIIEVVINEMFY